MCHKNNILLTLSFVFSISCIGCSNSFNTKLTPKEEMEYIQNKPFVSNTDEDYTIVFVSQGTSIFTYKRIYDEETVFESKILFYQMELGTEEDIQSWNNLVWNIKDFSKVRFYKIKWDLSPIYPIYVDGVLNLSDPSFAQFIKGTTMELFLFHFETLDDIKSTFVCQNDKNPSSNICIAQASWGYCPQVIGDDDYHCPYPSTFYLN